MRNVQKRAVLLEAQVVERTRELSEQTEQLAVARDNAEAANRAKSTFLSNMSHELRSPLNAILGFSQVMQRSSDLSSENRDNLDIISRSGEHLLTLINQVLDLSKIEAGQAALNETDFDLRQLLRDVENMFRLKAEEQNLQLLFEGTHDVPQYMRTDEVKLRQVLINLLNNALKFTDEGGISVRVGQRDAEGNNTRLVFEVEDTGAGIAEEEMAQLFEAFAQTETGRKSQEGTGLGLPISRRFVQLMGGDMTVSSQVGLGTVFHFEITAQEAETADLSTTTSSRRVIALQPGQKRYRILIVDDLVTNRQLLVRLLGPLGFELREAGNGQEAINIWEEFKPHLIWMDMRMPILNGYEATQHIKSTTQGQATAVIALTASSFEGERHVILSAGCDDYLRKPFRENEMFEMMHKYLGVDYVYEAEVGIDDGRAPETPLQTADLTPVPAFLLNQLAQAIESIDLAQMDETIDEIRQQEPKTAEKLSRLVKQFEYDIILTTIEEATEANDEHN
jgi:CheY-like chemotaxis protein/nitrogen-specific signal transduction histidine kinase